MSKTSKKRKLPKFSRLGKYFKLKKSSKKKDTEVDDNEDQNGRPSTPTCVPEYTMMTYDLDEKEVQEDDTILKEDVKIAEEKITSVVIDSKEENSVKTINKIEESINGVCHVDDSTRSKPVMHEESSNYLTCVGDILVHASLAEKSVVEETTDAFKICADNDEKSESANIGESATVSTPTAISPVVTTQADDSVEERDELIYPVLVQTPFQTQQENEDDSVKVGESVSILENYVPHGQPIRCNVIVHTPQPKKTEGTETKSVMKTTVDDDDDIFLSELPKTPSPKKLEKRGSQRALTVKKIRSIIATPYKHLKRDSSSIMDGQTYRYIEIQSLVKAFETLHSCKGGMIACNEKGLHYGKSSVLRIECTDCHTKVFLQATKN